MGSGGQTDTAPRADFRVDRQPPRDPARVAEAGAAMVAALQTAKLAAGARS